MKFLNINNKSFHKELDYILKKRSHNNSTKVNNEVYQIIQQVKSHGDKALFKYAKKFDKSSINKKNILLSKEVLQSYKNKIDDDILKAFRIAIHNITNFHKKQMPKSFQIKKHGVKTGAKWTPIQSVGLYIPGGIASYPSSLIMNVIPAKVSGVKRIVLMTPAKSNKINPYVLALIDELKLNEVYQIGGAHSIAALAFGTESIKSVNKIFGPGNAYVASAKKQVFGDVGIDLIAGPSEIVVVADSKNDPKWVASDLIAQAEHDEKAQSILITDNKNFANKVLSSIKDLITNLPKKNTIKKSLDTYGLIILVDDFKNCHNIINNIAPEHLHLQNKDRNKIYKKVINAGAIFLGKYSSEVFGDYIVGTNHILPTSGAAKFSSGLGVLDFMKRTSIVEMNFSGYQKYASKVAKMANIENLEGHKLSVKIRQNDKK